MKSVSGAVWPYNPAKPETWPMRNHGGRAAIDSTEGMPSEATRTPSANEPEIEEVIPDECQQGPAEDDSRGSVEPA